MRVALLLTALLGMAAALLGGGCRSSSAPPELIPFPLHLRSAVPSDSVTVTELPMDFSATFNQEIRVDQVVLQIVPDPVSLGTASAHGRTFDLSQLVLSSSSLAQWVVLDGADFLRPYVVRFFIGDARGDFIFPEPDIHPCLVSGDVGQVGEIMGNLCSEWNNAPSLENTLVFAYEKTAMPPDPELADLLLARPIAVTRATGVGVPVECTAYVITNLVIDVEYTLLAILDTNGDGRYEVENDWWGYPHDFITGALIFSSAHVYQCTPIQDMELRPPLESGLAP